MEYARDDVVSEGEILKACSIAVDAANAANTTDLKTAIGAAIEAVKMREFRFNCGPKLVDALNSALKEIAHAQ